MKVLAHEVHYYGLVICTEISGEDIDKDQKVKMTYRYYDVPMTGPGVQL